MTLLRTRSRTACLGTALSLTLAGCAVAGADTGVSLANQQAAASVVPVQLASLEPQAGATMTDAANVPLVRKGTVLWHRIGDETQPRREEETSAELKRLREAVERMQGQTTRQLSSLQDKLTSNEQALQQVAADQARQERELRSQTAEAVGNVARMAEESLRSMQQVARSSSEQWTQTNQQLAQLEERLKTAITDVRSRQMQADARTQTYTDLKVSQASLESQLKAVQEARQAATEAEERAKTFAGTRLAALEDMQASRLAKVEDVQEARLAAVTGQLAVQQVATEARLAAAEAKHAASLAAVEHVQDARFMALSSQMAAGQRLTEYQLAELRKVAQENRALASSETANVAAALREYADRQLARAQASTSVTLAGLARTTRQSVAALDKRTNQRMGVLWAAASQQAEKLAEEKANAVAASLAALQQQTAAQKVEPAQIRAIAEQTVAESTSEFRALALQTLKDGQNYIRSVARSAVQDSDPGMNEALAKAARDVITKDDKVVFAIRKAVAEELQGLATGVSGQPEGARTVLGPDHDQSAGLDDVQLDPNRLRIAQLLAPGGGRAPDAVPSDAQLAAISPAAGETGLGGQQAWSAQGTSLMRPRNRADWMDIRQYKVVVHQDNETLEELLANVLKRAEPFTGPWQVRWKISEENKDLMQEKFSLDAEATFEEFVSYLAQYIINDRGVKLSVSLFDSERIIVISD